MKHRHLFSLSLIVIIALRLPNECKSAQTKCSDKNPDGGINNVEKNQRCSRFTTTFESFFPLVDNEYWLKASREPAFLENISLSMYRYYMAQHLYARLVQIRAAKGLANEDEQAFAYHVQSAAPSLPYGVFTYLSAIGDIEVMDTQDNATFFRHFFEYSFIIWPNGNGDFGSINKENHWKYMSFPAPAIVGQAMQADLSNDENIKDDYWRMASFWTLKNIYSPSSFVNANCLGWKPAIFPTAAQRRMLQLCGILEGSFDSINSQFWFNPKLMIIIHEYLKASPQTLINTGKWYEDKPQNLGTAEQLAWLERASEYRTPDSRTYASIDRNVQGFLHPLQSNSEYVNKMSLILGFRVRKDAAYLDWRIPDSNSYEWIETRNVVFDFGDIGNVTGRAIPFSRQRDGIRSEFLEKCYQGPPFY